MAKEKTIAGVLNKIADEYIPWLMDETMKRDDISTEAKVTRTGLLDIVLHHLRILQTMEAKK